MQHTSQQRESVDAVAEDFAYTFIDLPELISELISGFAATVLVLLCSLLTTTAHRTHPVCWVHRLRCAGAEAQPPPCLAPTTAKVCQHAPEAQQVLPSSEVTGAAAGGLGGEYWQQMAAAAVASAASSAPRAPQAPGALGAAMLQASQPAASPRPHG